MNFQGRAQDKFGTLLYGFLILNLGSGFNQEEYFFISFVLSNLQNEDN